MAMNDHSVKYHTESGKWHNMNKKKVVGEHSSYENAEKQWGKSTPSKSKAIHAKMGEEVKMRRHHWKLAHKDSGLGAIQRASVKPT